MAKVEEEKNSNDGRGVRAMAMPFFIILILHSLAIYLFTRGFLLTRTELSAFSHCSDLQQHPNPCRSNHTHQQQPGCWTKPAVDRLVIIVLDALRNDFVAPSTFFPEAKPWMDKLKVLQKMASQEPTSARIFKAIADPPTTSLQRLKGLTTGGLPTFIDVGNSFGAPAIVEDNLIHQLAKNGKRVLMMGDDTWLQLFPNGFSTSYPYPSFNVKDLDTVDNGVIEHLIPSLYKDDWDVLIAHFLGVDHAGHIFGVDSTPMIEKLEQYNTILEEVIKVLKKQSGPGDLHENTFLLVMGDHGQTLNGDHGGGTSEEVETSLFAMSSGRGSSDILSILDESFCKRDLDGNKICISIFQQLDFAVTISALFGIPFPFGSIGRVNPELFALAAGTWDNQIVGANHCKQLSKLEAWKRNYMDALCINSWQVMRYIDLYSATSVMGLPSEDLKQVTYMYRQAQANLSDTLRNSCLANVTSGEFMGDSEMTVQIQIDAYSNFLKSVAKLARSAWTEFDMSSMAVGLACMVASLIFHLFAIRRIGLLRHSYSSAPGIFSATTSLLPFFLVAIRAASFLSNSYILSEGVVASFLLATTGILRLLSSVSKSKLDKHDFLFLTVIIVIRHGIGSGISKQNVGSLLKDISSVFVDERHPLLTMSLDVLPLILLVLLAAIHLKFLFGLTSRRDVKCVVILGTIFSYIMIALHLASQSNWMVIPILQDFSRNSAPRIVYAIGFGLLAIAVLNGSSNSAESLTVSSFYLLSAWIPTVMVLLGKQGPFATLIQTIGAWYIIRTPVPENLDIQKKTGAFVVEPVKVIQWSLLAICLFFYTGHWCTFDGLRYGAAFVGFDHFNIVRQGILLSIDTFGVSHILPIIGLPFLITCELRYWSKELSNGAMLLNLSLAFLIYGLITAVTTTLTIICVTIQRRHLMVWGLFAPKYVFDALGLLLTDVLIFAVSLCYFRISRTSSKNL